MEHDDRVEAGVGTEVLYGRHRLRERGESWGEEEEGIDVLEAAINLDSGENQVIHPYLPTPYTKYLVSKETRHKWGLNTSGR